jgi:hypothetical protein
MSERIEKRHWSVRTAANKNIEFHPIFVVNDEALKKEVVNVNDNEVECRFVDVKIGEEVHRFNFLDLFMFIYQCANEELRQKLQLRVEREITMIPYQVDFKLSSQERQDGKVRRRIELPLDDVAMYQAQKLANKHLARLASKGAPLKAKR